MVKRSLPGAGQPLVEHPPKATPTLCRCAVYTRTSTDERLGQAFNSLDAQQEACEAYIQSQKAEGWVQIQKTYADGGFSGGSMKRPALHKLLTDIKAGLVDAVVVYKIDRLTRSLRDFARIVELFEEHAVSFVSVTQHFSTSSSMGRLTLNVLLSFAQFEREMSSERVRDKIAASKQKGIWMGGSIPLGYDVVNRQLVINPAEAQIVRAMFDFYLETKSVTAVSRRLNEIGARTKTRVNKDGKVTEGFAFRPSVVRNMLDSVTYAGYIPHGESSYPGQHEAIITQEVFMMARKLTARKIEERPLELNAQHPSLLAGLVADPEGFAMSPIHGIKKGKRYRYYSNANTREHKITETSTTKLSIAAPVLEPIVREHVARWLSDEAIAQASKKELLELQAQAQNMRSADTKRVRKLMLQLVERVSIRQDSIQITLRSGNQLRAPFDLKPYGLKFRLYVEPEWMKKRDEEMAHQAALPETEHPRLALTPQRIALARSYKWREALISGQYKSVEALANAEQLPAKYIESELRRGLLAPEITEALLGNDAANAPPLDLHPSLSWSKQQEAYKQSKSPETD
ncbi:recombinase family protein [Variovorax sp. VNK109]|uniref:recombinase family protein n=1 Tax=Variovorax sp. VNK109 TaxID=3400919 RepID=UPI003C10F64F